MKFICDTEEPVRQLSKWASGKSLIICTFYFWGSGGEIQRSQGGLFRKMLHDAFSQALELIPEMFPEELDSCLLLGGENIFRQFQQDD